MNQPSTLRGSCLCRVIQYEIQGGLGLVIHCHCSMCRKVTGAAFRTRASVRADSFQWIDGEQLLGRYESSPGQTRTFCSRCGSTLITLFRDHPDFLGLALGTLDDDPNAEAAAHVHVASKAAWYTITDALPQFAEALPRNFAAPK